MSHFAEQDWIEFTRDKVTPERGEAMQQHLDAGCEPCWKALELWRHALEIAGREADYQPPESAVRSAKGAFALYKPAGAGSRVRDIAQLILDTFQQPVLAGVRSTNLATRQLLYKAGPFQIDVRLEQLPGSSRLSLVGQVMDATESRKGLHELPVVLRSGEQKKARTKTNQFGEFQLEFDPAEELHLSFELSREMEVIIPLSGFRTQDGEVTWI
jgi:hypothetical protein